MFRALTCPSSGGKIVFTQHLVSSLSKRLHSTLVESGLTGRWARLPFSPLSTSVLCRLRSILLMVANGHHNCIKCTTAYVRLKNSWWWAERLPEICRAVMPIKLEFSSSVGFIHWEFVTMHGHTIFKSRKLWLSFRSTVMSKYWLEIFYIIRHVCVSCKEEYKFSCLESNIIL